MKAAWQMKVHPADVSFLQAAITRSLNDISVIDESLRTGALDVVIERAHRMAGLTGALGLLNVASAAREMERASRSGNAEEARRLLQVISQLLLEVRLDGTDENPIT